LPDAEQRVKRLSSVLVQYQQVCFQLSVCFLCVFFNAFVLIIIICFRLANNC
jgi:hypothetical protein